MQCIFHAPGDDEKLAACLADRYAITTAKRLKGKGLPFWIPFLTSRGFVESGSAMSVYMVGSGITDSDRMHLVSMYALYLKDLGLVPRDYFQALAGDFSAKHLDASIFSDPMVMLARSTTMRWQGRAISIAAERALKGAVTFKMISEMRARVWLKGIRRTRT